MLYYTEDFMARPKKENRASHDLSERVQSNLPALLIGITIIVVFFVLSVSFLQKSTKKSPVLKKVTELFTVKKKPAEKPKEAEKVYVVREGDYLWLIAEQSYGSGYNAYDIAKANRIENPDLVVPGQKLKLPKVQAKQPTRGEAVGAATGAVTVQQQNYVVQQGDSLWKVAQNAYGDGYMWLKIAQANNIQNPDLIYPGQTLILPK